MATIPNGVYLILNGDQFANNFPGEGTHPPIITSVSFSGMSGPYSQWIVKHVGEGAYSIINSGSTYKAYVHKEEAGATVDGNSGEGVNFAIESAGDDKYVIKAINADLDWTVVAEQPGFYQVFLATSGKGDSQHFGFQLLRPIED